MTSFSGGEKQCCKTVSHRRDVHKNSLQFLCISQVKSLEITSTDFTYSEAPVPFPLEFFLV